MIIILLITGLEFKIKKNKYIDLKLLLLDHMEKKIIFGLFGSVYVYLN
jgi:hypothetical protein